MNDPSRDCHGVCLECLLDLKAPSRLAARDVTLYDFDPVVMDCASKHLGWTTLSSHPPKAIDEIKILAEGFRSEGLEAVVLLGQGGSSQASMTITKLHEIHSERTDVAFRTMDSLSPIFVNHILGSSDPARTLYIVSSKSGTTIEPLLLERVVFQYVSAHLGREHATRRFVCITDPGSELEKLAREKNYRLVLSSPTDVGGRFSVLSVFGLFPAALIGIDIEKAVDAVRSVEARCSSDDLTNPALDLACFLYKNYRTGRDKIALVMPPSGQVFGLWVEQMVAESLGKDGMGILPNVEVDASVLSVPHKDRCAITYEVGYSEGFRESIRNFDESIPARHRTLNSIEELFGWFVIWEYAIAFLGILLKVNPFDQPDVEETKKRVKLLLRDRPGNILPCDHFIEINYPLTDYIRTVRVSRALLKEGLALHEFNSVDFTLRTLLETLSLGDYFSLNAFLPFRGFGRREALERIRNRVVSRLGIASCLEIGPRYLHSTGQLHKGGPDTGTFLFLSADEENDIAIPGEAFTLGELAATQARGDFEVLSARGRRAIQVHLAGNDSETLSRFADRFCSAVSAIKRRS